MFDNDDNFMEFVMYVHCALEVNIISEYYKWIQYVMWWDFSFVCLYNVAGELLEVLMWKSSSKHACAK